MVDWRQIVRARLAELQLTPSAESALLEEAAQHLDDLHRDLQRSGIPDEEAYRRTVSELADICALRSGLDRSQFMPKLEPVPVGDTKATTLIDDLRRDLRYAARTLRANPLFTLIVSAMLGLGIGANTTVFTVINTLIVNPLPVPAPSELVSVASVGSVDAASGRTPLPLSLPNVLDYQTQNRVFRSLAGYARMRALTWQADGDVQPLLCEFVTGNYFSTLGVSMAAGRAFGTESDASESAQPVAVLNYGTWQTRFGDSPDIVGRQLRLNGVVVTVVGVARPGFIGVNGLVGPDLWAPVSLSTQLLPIEMRTAVRDRSKPLLQGIARLKPGVSLPQAQANVTALASALAREYPTANEGQTVSVDAVTDVLFGAGSRMLRFASVLLGLIAGVVLLIACSNVANLLLARSVGRQQELAVRLALGASRNRLVRQLLTESMCLGLLSGGVGLSIAYFGLQVLAKTLPATGTFVSSRLDATVLLFALLISLGTSVLCGILPAFAATRLHPVGVLKEAHAAGRSARRVTIANALLVGQVALSFVLLATAALFLRSIERAYAIDPGFNAERLAVLITNPGQAGYGEPQTKLFYQQVRERVARLPGIKSVSWASNMPLFARPMSGLYVEGRTRRSPSESLTTVVNTVDRGYFETAGVAIEKGRAFTELDRATSPPVAIVNQKLAHDLWPGQDAVGQRLRVPGEEQMREVVGIARTVNYSTWGESPQACVYLPLEQNVLSAMILYVRSQGDPALAVNIVRREIGAVAPQVLVSGIRTGEQVRDGSLFQARMGVALLSVFGFLALGLATIGLYGILAYTVRQRHREIGLRMALGASRPSVLRLVLREGLSLVGVGLAIGLVAALLVARVFSRILYGVGASDPASLAGAAVVLGVVAVGACYLPARWATRVDPLVALRHS